MDKYVSEEELDAHTKATQSRRVTLDDIEASIASEHYFSAMDGVAGANVHRARLESVPPGALSLLTYCVLVLKNGYTVTGQSACADPAAYNKAIGQKVARGDAIRQVWPLLGYALREDLHREEELLKSCAFSNSYVSDTYIGTKVVYARPMNRRTYNELRGWELPADENGDDEGYLVEYTDRVEKPQHMAGFLGYVSWSPKDVFERAYKKVGKAGA